MREEGRVHWQLAGQGTVFFKTGATNIQFLVICYKYFASMQLPFLPQNLYKIHEWHLLSWVVSEVNERENLVFHILIDSVRRQRNRHRSQDDSEFENFKKQETWPIKKGTNSFPGNLRDVRGMLCHLGFVKQASRTTMWDLLQRWHLT